MLREEMRPYTRSLMQQAHEKGTPVMRPLFYDFPEDPACWDNESQYMYGPDILVAPVMEAGMQPSGTDFEPPLGRTSQPAGRRLPFPPRGRRLRGFSAGRLSLRFAFCTSQAASPRTV